MPRNPDTGLYSIPPGTEAVTGTTISSAKFNQLAYDLATDQNTPRPVIAGGTGANTVSGIKLVLDKTDFARLSDLLDDETAYPVGSTMVVRETGHSYRVVTPSEAWHYKTAAEVCLMALGGELKIADGQSNIASSNAHASEGGSKAADDRIKAWNGTNWVKWDPENGVPANYAQAGRNYILFQAAKAALRRGVPCVWCVNFGNPGDKIAEWVSTGVNSPNFAAFKTTMDAVFAHPDTATAQISKRSIIWGQGESDGSGTFSLTAYRTAFETLKGQWRALPYITAETPITVLEMPPQPSASVTNAYIMDTLPYDGDPYTAVTRTQGLQIGDDTLHWTGTGMDLIGARADAVTAAPANATLNSPSRITTPFMKVRFDPVFGKGLGINYVAADDRIILGSTSDASGDAVTQPFLGFDLDNALLMLSQSARAYHGLTLASATGANFASAAHAVNTDPNKMAGTMRFDSVNGRLMIATGTGAAAAWVYFGASGAGSVTPA